VKSVAARLGLDMSDPTFVRNMIDEMECMCADCISECSICPCFCVLSSERFFARSRYTSSTEQAGDGTGSPQSPVSSFTDALNFKSFVSSFNFRNAFCARPVSHEWCGESIMNLLRG
jgi:hypothetical protein